MNNLSETLKKQAVSLGLCKKWTEEWGDCDQQELIDKYIKGIDFCIENQYPSNEFIKANFDRSLLNQNLIFVDEYLDIKDAASGVYILNGECSGTLYFREWSAATIYVRHNSEVTVVADDFAKVFVRVYDDARADVLELDDATVKVYDRR